MKTALPSRVAFAGLLTLAALVLAGCTEVPVKNYIEPVGGDAEACLEVCRAERFSCRTEAQREAEGCQQRYDYRYERWRQCVLTRGERLAKLKEMDRWSEGDGVLGLPKVRVQKVSLKKKKKVKKADEEEGGEEKKEAKA